jgi:hypothetical protein
MNFRRLGLLLLLALSAACADSGEREEDPAFLLGLDPLVPLQKPEGTLTFPHFDPAESPTVRSASFWAVVGQQRSISIDYAGGDEFLRFTVGPVSLLKKPDGMPFLPGDSVLITVTLDEDDRLIAQFEPSGLTFNPIVPARLRMSIAHANPDYDGDGDVDSADAAIEAGFTVWKQELQGLPWLKLPNILIGGGQFDVGIGGFTGFAVASS